MGRATVVGFNALTTTPWGQCFYNRYDQTIGRCLEHYGEFSEGELHLLRFLTPKGSIFLDVGANIGTIAVPMAQHVGPDGAVVAFEPQRLTYQLLCANAAVNSLGNFYAVRSAVGAQNGSIRVPRLDPNASNTPGCVSLSTDENVASGELVSMLSIDSLDAVTLAMVSMMKVDVEGMEMDVINGARGLISKNRPYLYVENDRVEHRKELPALIRSLGYKLYWHLPLLVTNKAELQTDVSGLVSFNMICIPVERPHEMSLEEVEFSWTV